VEWRGKLVSPAERDRLRKAISELRVREAEANQSWRRQIDANNENESAGEYEASP
jgi:hypothetical protein